MSSCAKNSRSITVLFTSDLVRVTVNFRAHELKLVATRNAALSLHTLYVNASSVAAASIAAQSPRGKTLPLRDWKSDAVGDCCYVKAILSAYIRHDNDISLYASGFQVKVESRYTLRCIIAIYMQRER